MRGGDVGIQQISTEHGDVIHHVSYNYYGNRIATCAADQKVKVWDRPDGGGGAWTCSWNWKAHKGSVWRLDWAHAEYGSIVATCSFDKTVCIWEEPGGGGGGGGGGPSLPSASTGDGGASPQQPERPWILRATLVDSRDSVEDVKFAPHHLGLRLATCSLDGYVRFYDARDIMNLSIWNADGDFLAHGGGATCVAWNPSPFDPPTVVVGSKANEVGLWEYVDVQSGWVRACELRGHESEVYDVAWAPNLGRSFHLVATASKDRTVRVWKFPVGRRADAAAKPVEIGESERLPHPAEVWKVEWNVTGTVLATSADDGHVRLWRENFRGQWEVIRDSVV